ncbi:MAG TPA: transcription-repair coupling factor [Oscillospiraceae bacterium]|nr:transcription-repair coupling factor [Oscillospiraceae bacterium]
MNIFRTSINKLDGFKQLSSAVEGGFLPCSVTGVSGIHKAQMIFGLFGEKSILAVTDDEASARRLCDDINELNSETISYLYPAKDFNFIDAEGVSREYEYQRLSVLSKLLSGEKIIVTASAEAVLQRTISPDKLKRHTLTLKASEEVSIKELSEKLISCGYTRSDQVEGASQFSVRGAIIDIFPVQSAFPYRIELWGDEIDTISSFDTETQRRIDTVKKITISPASEVIYDNADELVEKISALSKSIKGKHAELIRQKLENDIERLKSGIGLYNIDKYLTLCDTPSEIFDYTDGLICVNEIHNVSERAKGYISQYNEDVKILLESGDLCRGLDGYIMDFSEFTKKILDRKTIFFDTFMRGTSDVKFIKLINITAFQTAPWGGEIRQLTEDLDSFCKRGYSTIVMAGSEKTLPIIADDLNESGIPCDILKDGSEPIPGRVLLMTGCVSGGYDYPDSKQALITQAKAMSAKRKLKKRKKGEEIKSLSDISQGDLVVHALHGIGRFEGIRKLELEGVIKDYITIKYAGTDVLYVPVTQLDLVSKYIGPRDDSGVKLNKLSSMEWQKTRSRVKSAVKDMADELIALYAKRANTKGFAFSPDNDWQQDFEERFDYSETDDQLRSIEEIKSDMQKPLPMDRLLCGDVGFGKTEVALRGAFKCVLDDKQCAILVPTTVLAWQHYQTAIKRFEHFPVKVELLSRFRTPKQQAEILKQLKRGEVDIIIGTHRIVQKDVEFKNLGLVIIDEEQRFGVAHKERFKEMFSGVDVLTLSATPIPRTLNMAMSGIRDMSVIEEPPQDRYPVQTYVVEHNMGIIIQAISKELRRGGQVYYIHNRIETIDLCAAKLKEQLPDANIGIAHGKITEEELSEVWRKLVDHEIDILVCTTLIETGVDVPNCNTLIIEDADRLGLSQLYQLRGRVGRSNRRAFAYFTFRRGKVLTEIASKRLDAIREFTQFGSGFRIALRDLEIRGAGSLLGGKQHGHMEAVGYDMYLQLLSEAIAEEKGEPAPHTPEECLVDVQIEAHIPEKYIESLSQRIDVYRKIAGVATKDESADLIDELIDRYGEPPKAIIGLINVALMRNTASRLHITEISQRGESLLFYTKSPSSEQISRLSGAFRGRVMFSCVDKSYISVKLEKGEKAPDLMQKVLDVMSESAEN